MIYKLYNGNIELDFDEAKHVYRVDGEPIISVTGVSAPKPGLVWWAAREAADYVKEHLKPGVPLDEIEIEELCEAARKAHSRKASKAALIGTTAHAACEAFIKGEEPKVINQAAKNSFDSFLAWVEDNDVEFIASEAKVYHNVLRYAGTLDVDAVVNGERCIVDLKTSNAIYPEMRLQVAAYARAREQELGIQYKRGWILRLPKDKSGFEAVPVDTIDEDFVAFLGLLEYYRWAKSL